MAGALVRQQLTDRILKTTATGLIATLVACGGSHGLGPTPPPDLKQPESAPAPAPIPDDQADAKKKERDTIAKSAENAGEIQPGWRPTEKIENLIDETELVATNGRILNKPAEIDQLGFRAGDVSSETWSGNIWSQYRGHTGWRYNVEAARDVKSWKQAWSFITKKGRSFLDIVRGTGRKDAGALDDLSPAEKYDLLVGDPAQNPQGLLAQAEFKRGEDHQEQDGSVAKWYGYCHGWAPASFMTKRPEHSVEVPSFDGSKQIKFYPHDIKALATVLWANALPPLRLVGNRCDIKNPPRDENGRIIDENCLDVNPGVFHMALVNQIGIAHRNLLIDATYDEQIWNQPIVSYKYRYFNPRTKAESDNVAAATIALKDFPKDKFKKYRVNAEDNLVGVLLEIRYAKGVSPTHEEFDSHENDKVQTVNYSYDLELNASGEIVGGEWYQLKHPDFIWVPVKDARAVSDAEADLDGEWDPSQPVPTSWREPAARAANLNQPLAKVVEGLIEAARR